MFERLRKSFDRVLDPIDRLSEVLFGLIMVLTSTTTLSVLTAGKAEVRTMIIGALGCNIAWGIIDAALYLMSCIDARARGVRTLRTVRQGSPEQGRQAIADSLPQPLVSVLSSDELDSIRGRLQSLPDNGERPRPTAEDWLGALAVCLLVVLSTFPPVLPFLFMESAQPALRVSNAIAISLLFLCGYLYAQHAGFRPWLTGLVMVAVGTAMVAIAVALGG